jgi:hypothetical protein
MIPTEVHAADPRPVRRKFTIVDGNGFLRDGKYSIRAQYRDALDPGFSLVRRI